MKVNGSVVVGGAPSKKAKAIKGLAFSGSASDVQAGHGLLYGYNNEND